MVTGSRAEYGLLRRLMMVLRDDPDVVLQTIVTGAHLSVRHGETWHEIVDDGFAIDARVDIDLTGDEPVAIVNAMGLATAGIGRALEELAPDLMILLGDRYEILCAAQAALVMGIPVAHLHGGESTVGVVDEAFRHSITKMAQVHFVAADDYRRRVIQLGEMPERVYTVGALGLDAISALEAMPRAALEAHVGLALEAPLFLVTCHPETLRGDAGGLAEALVGALSAFTNATVVVTGTNADTAGSVIAERLEAFVRDNPARARLIVNLGQTRYLNLMREADVVIGNSSSGILEAPSLGTPTVDIGMRQQGRLRAPSVIYCGADKGAIVAAINRALTPEFKLLAARKESPFGTPGASERIARALKSLDLASLTPKRFFDISFDNEAIRSAGGARR